MTAYFFSITVKAHNFYSLLVATYNTNTLKDKERAIGVAQKSRRPIMLKKTSKSVFQSPAESTDACFLRYHFYIVLRPTIVNSQGSRKSFGAQLMKTWSKASELLPTDIQRNS